MDDDPFDDVFREIERMMNDVVGQPLNGRDPTGFSAETHVSVQETPAELRVVADLPAFEKDALSIQCDGETLTIRLSDSRRDFSERVELPSRVDPNTAEATFNNGILEITLERAADSTDISVE